MDSGYSAHNMPTVRPCARSGTQRDPPDGGSVLCWHRAGDSGWVTRWISPRRSAQHWSASNELAPIVYVPQVFAISSLVEDAPLRYSAPEGDDRIPGKAAPTTL